MRVFWSWCGGCRCNKGSGMKTIRGSGIFLAQFAGAESPFNTLAGLACWAGEMGTKGVQIPTRESALLDLKREAPRQSYGDAVLGLLVAQNSRGSGREEWVRERIV